MKSLTISVLASILAAGCASSAESTSTSSAATTTSDLTPATIAPQAALAQLKAAVPLAFEKTNKALIAKPSNLPSNLKARFDHAQASLEDFGWAHSDQGDEDAYAVAVLSAPGASTFVGYAVYAYGTDDSDSWSASAVEYYTTDGKILDIDSVTAGRSDSEDAGNWDGVDDKLLAAQEQTLRGAFTFDAAKTSINVDKTRTTTASIDAVPFKALVNELQTELQKSTWAHSDMGDDATWFVSVKGADGKIAGYILAAEGGDDSDNWFAAGYALFSANGQLLGREIASAGLADTMTDDAILLYSDK